MSEVQDALAQLDFNATAPYMPIEPGPDDSVRKIVKTMENASVKGDLALIKDSMADLLRLPRTEKYVSSPGSTLYLAIEHQHTHIVTFLLDMDVCFGQREIKWATRHRDTKTLDLLLEHGWDINAPLVEWAYPPPMALAVQDLSLAKWFLDHGADPNAACGLDMTSLSVAVEKAPIAVIELLFSHGGSITSGQLLHYAVRRNLPDHRTVVELILSKGASVNRIMYQDLHCYYLQRAFALGTPLHEAAALGKLETVKLLLERGASPLIRDSLGDTPRERAGTKKEDGRLGEWEAVVEALRLSELEATPVSVQYTDGRRATGWG